ncbi:MAG: hypothetical protein WD449_02210 [Candidatus Babeliales bacterium]
MVNFSIERALGWGFRTTWQRFGLMISVAGTWFLLTIITEALKVAILGAKFNLFNIHFTDITANINIAEMYTNPLLVAFFVTKIVVQLVQEGLKLGIIKIGLDLYDGKSVGYTTLFSSFSILIKYIVATFLYGLVVGLGTVAFIIPGIYLALRYWMYGFVLVDTNVGIIDSLKASAVMTQGVKWHLFWYSITANILVHLGYITFFGILYIWPAIQLANIYIYRKCSAK